MDAYRKQQEQEHFKQMRKEGLFNDEQELAAEKKREREKQVSGMDWGWHLPFIIHLVRWSQHGGLDLLMCLSQICRRRVRWHGP